MGELWNWVYILELITLITIILVGREYFLFAKHNTQEQRKTVYFTFGIVFFLMFFWVSNYFGEITQSYEINLIGPVGMVLFLAAIAYVMVRYHAFNTKLFSSQILVTALGLLIGSLLFIQNINYIHNAVIFTFLLVIMVGFELVKSVKREIEQREKIEKLALDLERANTKLKELDQLKSEFLSFASHQLRSPLTAIKGYTSMALEGDFGKLPTKIKETIQVIDTSAQNLVVIVNDFLNISRIEQGRMKYDLSDFDIVQTTEEVVKELRPNVEQRGLTLDFVPQTQSFIVNADLGKVRQVIGNIIDNAIKYTPTGGIKVAVSHIHNKVRISIKDTGIGIDPDEIDKLFSKFTRAKDAYKTNVTGTGLGLYVAKQMIEAQKGRVWVESEGKGKGSTFFIELNSK